MSLAHSAKEKPGGDGHPSYLAHHYDTPEQQFAAGKVGMWIFLATEILMFGALFCAYAVYRYNHPDVFMYAHQYLDKWLGALNTAILITSSLTMAWGVRMAQLNHRRGLVICLVLTLCGGAGFMVVKSIEYTAKYKHHLWIGSHNQYDSRYAGPKHEDPLAAAAKSVTATPVGAQPVAPVGAQPVASGALSGDPNTGTPDAAVYHAPAIRPGGIAPEASAAAAGPAHQAKPESELSRKRISTFFSIYFLMTGLHGLHVLIGMSLIAWILIRSIKGHFSAQYFAPVDLVGLYWHLVDLIWIFLFPMLYLIH